VIFKIVDQIAQQTVAYLDAPDLPVAEAWARNTAALFPESFPNGAIGLLPVRVEKSEVPAAYHAALFRFGEVIVPPAPAGSGAEKLAWYEARNLLRA
jgi:hypothetical protein